MTYISITYEQRILLPADDCPGSSASTTRPAARIRQQDTHGCCGRRRPLRESPSRGADAAARHRAAIQPGHDVRAPGRDADGSSRAGRAAGRAGRRSGGDRQPRGAGGGEGRAQCRRSNGRNSTGSRRTELLQDPVRAQVQLKAATGGSGFELLEAETRHEKAKAALQVGRAGPASGTRDAGARTGPAGGPSTSEHRFRRDLADPCVSRRDPHARRRIVDLICVDELEVELYIPLAHYAQLQLAATIRWWRAHR